jgi:prepilin-type N-terminal cleavage/methylation domain-containing protein
MNPRRKRAFSLVEILVVLVVLAILAAIMLPRYLGSGKTASGKTVESPMQRAHSAECMNNLSQVRQAYQMAASADENRPRSIADLKAYGVTDSIARCPVGKEPYQLDPASGRVWCPHPGHDGY